MTNATMLYWASCVGWTASEHNLPLAPPLTHDPSGPSCVAAMSTSWSAPNTLQFCRMTGLIVFLQGSQLAPAQLAAVLEIMVLTRTLKPVAFSLRIRLPHRWYICAAVAGTAWAQSFVPSQMCMAFAAVCPVAPFCRPRNSISQRYLLPFRVVLAHTRVCELFPVFTLSHVHPVGN